MKPDITLILGSLIALAAVLLLLRFGKILAKWLLIFGGLAVAGVFGLALLFQATATRQAVQAATVATGASFGGGILFGLLLAAAAIAGYFCVRWRLTEHQRLGPHSWGWIAGPNARWRRHRPPEQSQPVVYIVEDEGMDEEGDALQVLRDLDLSQWGW